MEVERSIQNIHLTQQQLLSMVQKAFPNCQSLDGWQILSGGALNTTYRFQIGSQAFILRIYARDRAHCKTEKAIHQLIEKNVSTPKLLFADELHEPWAYSIFEFVDGRHLTQVSNDHKLPLSYELGRQLACIHAFKFPQAGLFGEGISIGHPFETGSSPYFEEAFKVLSKGENARRRLGERLSEDTLAFMEKNKDFFPVVKENICLTHSDFKPVNLLYNADETVKAADCKVWILDWEFAHAGIGILDFSILLRYKDHFPLDLSALEKGYTEHGGHLSEEWIREAFITDFVNIITLIDTPTERPRLFHQMRGAVQYTLDHWN